MPDPDPQPCSACGAGGTARCLPSGDMGPCQPAVPDEVERCGNSCDEDADNEVNENCAGSKTFDYCERLSFTQSRRWTCACGDDLKVGYCLGSADPQTSCNSASGCLKAPAFGTSGAFQVGGDFQCCVSSLPCEPGFEGYVDSAMHCESTDSLRFECRPGVSCDDSNGCGDTCAGLAPDINPATGEREGGGAYCAAGPVCSAAQGGFGAPQEGQVTASIYRVECVECTSPEGTCNYNNCYVVSRPGLTLSVPPPEHGDRPHAPGEGDGREEVGDADDVDEEVSRPAPETGDACQVGAPQGSGVAAASVTTPRVSLSDFTSRYSVADLGLRGTLGGFNFVRKYVSTDNYWSYQSMLGSSTEPFIPKPFGSSPTRKSSLRWWHSLYSMVEPKGWVEGVSTWAVRDTEGSVLEFAACTPGTMGTTPCFATPRDTTRWSNASLQWTGSHFVLIKPGEGRFVYQSGWSVDGPWYRHVKAYFLTRVEEDRGSGTPRVRLSLTYETPAVTHSNGQPATCPGQSTLDNGVPYLKEVTTEDGAKLRLYYRSVITLSSNPASECVIDRLALRTNPNSSDPALSQQEVTVAQYEYWRDPSLPSYQRAGLLAKVEYPETGDVVSYEDSTASGSESTSWGVSVNQQMVASHSYQSGKVSSVVSGGTSAMTVSSGSGNCGGPVSQGTDAGTPCVPPRLEGTTATSGDSAGTTVQFLRSFSTRTSPYSPHPLLRTVEDDCLSGNCMSFASGYVSYQYEEPEDGTLFVRRFKDKAHRYALNDVVFADAGTASIPGVVSPVAKVTRSFGQDYYGDGGVPGPTTDYVYADAPLAADRAWKPVKVTVDTLASVFNPGGQVTTRTTLDEATGATKSIIQSGFTHQLDPSSGTWSGPVAQHLGVFYFNHYRCLGEADTGAEILKEVHGPCAVSGPEATDCSGTDFPITQYHYYGPPSAERSNRANRLMKVTRFLQHGGPTACAGFPVLETRYDEYDARGNPTRIISPQGEGSTAQYTADRLTSLTTGGMTLTYLYEGGHVRATRSPAGVYRVRCYRKDTVPGQGCTGGQLTDRLQWEATAADEHGSDWSQRRVFEYWPNGALKSEKLRSRLSGVEETRRTVTHHPDPHLRPTFTRWGEGPGSYAATAAFDVNNNPAATGFAFNTPPDFCKSGGDWSPACATFAHDNLNRLTRMSEFPSGSTGQHALFEYDAHGNVRSLRTGCEDPEGTSCPAPSTYRYDDFGRLAEVQLPNVRGPVRYAYDARGNMRVKQTPAMLGGKTFVSYAYDLLSRLRTASSVHWPDGYQALHFKLGYDSDETPPAGCETLLNSLGRLRFRQDNFGRTWFQYDAAGRVVREMRVRAGATACGQGLEANPDTRYTYDTVGRVASVTYPHGRTVSYVYGTGAHAEKVSAVDVTQYDGSSWQVRRVLSGAVWEPYGGLRGYQLHHAGSGTVSSAEYMLGDDASVAPASSASACGDTPPAMAASDLTGRLRAVRVSSGAFSPGAGTGDIFSRTYTWAADQVSRTDTCVLDSAEAQTELFSYDKALRLTSAGRPTGNHAATGGAYMYRTYGYDRRGNRTAASEDGTVKSLTYWASPPNGPDALGVSSTGPGPNGLVSEWYFYDSDGRFDRKATARSGPAGTHLQLYPTYYTGHGFLEGVFQAVDFTSGASYNYYYDALGRRRLKVHPTGTREEYFHDLDNQLISDSGPDDVITPGYYVEDDYVWLGGRPVAVLRGKFSTGWTRLADDSTDCARAGTPAACGLYFLVTDHGGKPVLALDDSQRISGVGEYDPFGHVNRDSRAGGSANPYGDNLDVELVRHGQPVRSSQLRLQQRVLFDLIETEATHDYAVLADGTTGAQLAGPYSGQQRGKRWSEWVEAESGVVSVRFVSNATCGSAVCGADAGAGPGCTCPNTPLRGVVVRASEYRRFQQGATPFWVSLRFPGHYHDAETDLFENWNRYYDPGIGRYLQPEPRLAMAPSALPTYAYALNNPLWLVDENGLAPRESKFDTEFDAAVAGFKYARDTMMLENYEVEFYIYKAGGKFYYTEPREIPRPPGKQKVCDGGKVLFAVGAEAVCHTHPSQCNSQFSPGDKGSSKSQPKFDLYLMNGQGAVFHMLNQNITPKGTPIWDKVLP